MLLHGQEWLKQKLYSSGSIQQILYWWNMDSSFSPSSLGCIVYRILLESKLKLISNVYGIKTSIIWYFLDIPQWTHFWSRTTQQTKEICGDKIGDEGARRDLPTFSALGSLWGRVCHKSSLPYRHLGIISISYSQLSWESFPSLGPRPPRMAVACLEGWACNADSSISSRRLEAAGSVNPGFFFISLHFLNKDPLG